MNTLDALDGESLRTDVPDFRPGDTLKVIDDVLTQLDADPITEQGFFIYAVKNGQSADMATTLNSLFSSNSSSSNSGRSNTSGMR